MNMASINYYTPVRLAIKDTSRIGDICTIYQPMRIIAGQYSTILN